MSPDTDPVNGQRLGYQATIAAANFEAPAPPAVVHLFTDHLDTLHSPRPALQQLLHHVRHGDTVVISSMAQIAKSVVDLRRVVADCISRGANVEFAHEQITFGQTTAPAATELRVLEVIANFDRARQRERQQAGIAAAKDRGVYKGRVRSLNGEQAEQLRQRADDAGESKTALARELGISRETVYQYLRQARAAAKYIEQYTAI